MLRIVSLLSLIAIYALTLCATAQAGYLGESDLTGGAAQPTASAAAAPSKSALEVIEDSLYEDFPEAPITWGRTSADEYLTMPNRKTAGAGDNLVWADVEAGNPRCWPAPGKSICGEGDPSRHLLIFSHGGCCTTNVLMYYSNVSSLQLPTRDLSRVATAHGLTIGSTQSQVEGVMGQPNIFHGVSSGRMAYTYFRPNPKAGNCGRWIMFVFDKQQRVTAILDSAGC